jgi:hypothetical protein
VNVGGTVALLAADGALGVLMLWWLLGAGFEPTPRQIRIFYGGLAVLLPLLVVAVLWWLRGR